MIWNPHDILTLLTATIEGEHPHDFGTATIFNFRDSLMNYQLIVTTGEREGIFLAADPERPVQGLPHFETSLACCRIAPLARSGMPTGIAFFIGPDWKDVRFSITRREDGNISLSGVWP